MSYYISTMRAAVSGELLNWEVKFLNISHPRELQEAHLPKKKQFAPFRNTAILTLLLSLLVVSCDRGPKSGYGFALPDGDAAKGSATFASLHCGDCHVIEDRPELRSPDPLMSVPLGGATSHVKTYGDLVTSVINPSHKISQKFVDETIEINGQSMMRNYNDVLTVAQLIDLVAFLQAEYDVRPPAGPSYQTYSYPHSVPMPDESQ